MRLLSETGASARVLHDGHRHESIELRFAGSGHRIDFMALTGRAVWLYPQHEVLRDLVAARLQAGQVHPQAMSEARIWDELDARVAPSS